MDRFLLILTFLALCVAASAQSIESLRSEIKRAEQEIKINTELLNKTRKDKSMTQNQLKMIQARITNRKNIISSLEKQITLIGRDIETKRTQVGGLSTELTTLKKSYAQMIYTAYKNYKLNNFLVFLFASKDFNDITKRVAFMRRYNHMRQIKAIEIDSVSKRLGTQIHDLDSKLVELDNVKTSRSKEIETMGHDESQYKNAVVSLKKTESKLATTVREKQNQINKAQQQIQRIIAEEARKSKSVPKSAAEQQYNTELSGRFDQNMGKLPYPVRPGVIIDSYGVHAHPTQKGLTVNNKGVNFAADKGAEVRCVFEGVVSRIFFFQGLNNSVMVRHGNYITVYSNLATVAVKTGDNVALNQVLGRLSTGDDSDEYMLHFEIWKETTNLNPVSWLRR